MHIYLIDDEDTFNFLNKTVVKMAIPKAEISVFSNGQDGLNALKKTEDAPDLIFLDMYMPVLNGWDFLAEFEKLECPSKIAMLTASIDPSEKAKALSYSKVLGVFSKPLTPELVQELLADI